MTGVGQVVLQVAAASECKVCYGIERVEWPAKYALVSDVALTTVPPRVVESDLGLDLTVN